MTMDVSSVLAGVRALWRRDRALIGPVSGLFVFLPQYAVLLLVPAMPPMAEGMTFEAWSKALEPWVSAYGGWFVAATLLGQYGALAVVSLFAAPVPTAGAALARAVRLFPRALLAGLLVTFPCGVAALAAFSVPLLPVVLLPGVVYVLARTALTNPVILGERGTSATGAIARSWRLTRGRGLPIALLVGAILLGGQTFGALVVAVERVVRAGPFANPVLLAMVDGLAAGVAWGAALLLALVEVVLYRRLTR